MRDILGIGALNTDYIATRQRLLRIDSRVKDEVTHKFEFGTEHPVDPEEIESTLRQMGQGAFEVCLGGSAFNTIQAVSSLNNGLALGYVGVIGKSIPGNPSFMDYLHRNNIDKQFVFSTPDEIGGTCISYIHDGERSLLTCPGANVRMGEFLDANVSTLVPYLGCYRLVHITSFFDDHTPNSLANLIENAKALNPWLKVSFDPGHHWCVNRTPAVDSLLKQADFLFLNAREFELLGHYRPGSSDRDVAGVIFEQCHSASTLILLKRYNSIVVFSRICGRVVEFEHANKVLEAEQIEDATGAGDVFAAGFLTGRLVPGFENAHSIELGLRLVRHKLLSAGTSGFVSFPRILEEYVDSLASTPPAHTVSQRPKIEISLSGSNTLVLRDGFGHTLQLTDEQTKFFCALAATFSEDGIPGISSWRELNKVSTGSVETNEPTAVSTTRTMLSRLQALLTSSFGEVPNSVKWIRTIKGNGLSLCGDVDWVLSDELIACLFGKSVSSGRFRAVDPRTLDNH